MAKSNERGFALASRMQDESVRFTKIIAAIDAVNATDPNLINVDGEKLPGEFVYGRRMSNTLARLEPNPSTLLQIAARGQHIERWKVQRSAYPPGRAGYLAWRKYQRNYQAERIGELMTAAGYLPEDIDGVGQLIRKEGLNVNPEAQTLEDVVCVMFLKYYLRDFMPRVDENKLAGILAKTWKRMSERGHQAALELNLPARVHALLKRGLADLAIGSKTVPKSEVSERSA